MVAAAAGNEWQCGKLTLGKSRRRRGRVSLHSRAVRQTTKQQDAWPTPRATDARLTAAAPWPAHSTSSAATAATATTDAIFEAAVEAGADDVDSGADEHIIISAPEQLSAVRAALDKRFGPPASAKVGWKPKTAIPVDGETAEALFKLLEALEDSDDVQNVFANFEVSDDVMARLSA